MATGRRQQRRIRQHLQSTAYRIAAPVETLCTPWRFCLSVVVLLLLPLAAGWGAFSLQVREAGEHGHHFLQQRGSASTVYRQSIDAHRGQITDRHGAPLAVSIPMVSLYAVPSDLATASAEQRAELARLLGILPAALDKSLAQNSQRQFMYLRRQVEPALASQALQLELPGVHTRPEYRRYYPSAEVSASVVGLTNVDDRGLEGMELAYDRWLQGSPGNQLLLRDRRGSVIRPLRVLQQPRRGRQLQSSIDLRLQYLAYRELKEAIATHGAISGSIVVLDIPSGEVLAVANQPSHNPNDRRVLSLASQRNRAVLDLLEPGSTIKPFAAAAALESGLYTPQTLIDTSPGHLELNGKELSDPHDYGTLSLSSVIARSSQVGISRVALELPSGRLPEMLRRVGFGQGTGSGFPGEPEGRLPRRDQWNDLERATLAFGHGMSATVLQLARAYAVFGGDGLLRPVTFQKRRSAGAAEGVRVMDRGIAQQLLDMLEGAVAPGGTGHRAALLAYRALGKTGTVHKIGGGGYQENQHIALFAGLAPASRPRIVVVVMVDEPRGDTHFGGSVSAPVFSRVADFALRLLNVPPDRLRVAFSPPHNRTVR